VSTETIREIERIPVAKGGKSIAELLATNAIKRENVARGHGKKPIA
jgi:hypothetical protein